LRAQLLSTTFLPYTTLFRSRVLDSTGALALKELPESIVVIGGGYIGTELGSAYANLGTKVTIIEGEKEILSTFEKSMTNVVKRRDRKSTRLNSSQVSISYAV